MANFNERREHERVDARLSIFVEVVERTGGREAGNRILRSHSVDVSAGGLKLWLPELIAATGSVHTTLQRCFPLRHGPLARAIGHLVFGLLLLGRCLRHRAGSFE